ncbi:hypothetical protein [Streptomyces cyanogenus]|uniref:Secreted protein n=1 Tax=Streptomyces cyanogenus TaxID=80860 RepID=A0ABX7TPJ6_STRCY|nr:hypothetical protein [Streptomyces cyanogenus]QTD98634.1 hypothetical protein S1361_14855 [Streptomyces cyanogenus]
MKSLKAAAVVAGSLALAGVAAPAFAASGADLSPQNVSGTLDKLTGGPVTTQKVLPVQGQSVSLDTEKKDSPLGTVKGAASSLTQRGGLLGGLPVHH